MIKHLIKDDDNCARPMEIAILRWNSLMQLTVVISAVKHHSIESTGRRDPSGVFVTETVMNMADAGI